MIKRLLNNPMAVAGLVLVAVVITFWNVITPFVKSFAPDIIVDFMNEAAPAQEQAVRPPPRMLDYSRVGWVDSPARDPFRAPAPTAVLPRVKEEERVSAQPPRRQPPARERLRLVAVVVEPGMKYATINKTHVAEGDSIEGYRVVGITPNSVSLSGPLGKETLIFEKQKALVQSGAISGDHGE